MTIRAKLKKPQPPTSSDDGVGSVVLKGFTVPSGFVLHYTTNTGADKSATEGEYVNTSHKFKEVQSGQVPGWSLQKVQSDFSFEMEDEEEELEFEDHTFTPWGDKATVLGVPVLSENILRKMNMINRLGGLKAKYTNPEISDYLAEIRTLLENTYKIKPALSEQDVLDTLNTINRNISLLLTLEKAPYIKRLFDVNNPPDVTDPKLEETLNPKNAERVNLDNLSPELLKTLCTSMGITAEEFVKEVSSGITRKDFEAKYGQYIRVNSVKVGDLLCTKGEAREFIEEAILSVPEEVRPVVLTYIGGADLVNQTVDEVINTLKEADYFFTGNMSQEDLESIDPKDDLTIHDLRKTKVEGFDYIPGRFEILKRIISKKMLIELIREGSDEDDSSNQSIQDTVSEIIENYIEYLGGDISIYKVMMRDWVSGRNGAFTKALLDWAAGENTAAVREIRPTLNAIQSAHSDLFKHVFKDEMVYRPVMTNLGADMADLSEVSIEATSPLVSFTLDKDAAMKFVDDDEHHSMLISSKVLPSKVQFIPGLYMPKSYWKHIGGKPVYVNRESFDRDDTAEVVIKTSSIVIKKRIKEEKYDEVQVVV